MNQDPFISGRPRDYSSEPPPPPARMPFHPGEVVRNGIHFPAPSTRPFSRVASADVAQIVCLTDVESTEVNWLWPGRIALGKATLLAGDPGLGKSLLCCDLAARVSRGAAWPDMPQIQQVPAGVVMLAAEDGLADTIRPRLEAHGADLARIVALQGITVPSAAGDRRRGVDLSTDLAALESAIGQARDCRLVIVDPVSAYLGKIDANSNGDVRAVLDRLADLAERTGVALIAVTHLRKSVGPAMYRAMGSLAFVAAARAAWVVCRDPDSPGRRLALPIKNNLAPDVGGLAFEVESVPQTQAPGANWPVLAEQPIVVWDSKLVHASVDEVLAPSKKRGPGPEARERAKRWLAAFLADGPCPQREVREVAADEGVSYGSLRRAFADLRGLATKTGPGGGWEWSLPWRAPVGELDPVEAAEEWLRSLETPEEILIEIPPDPVIELPPDQQIDLPPDPQIDLPLGMPWEIPIDPPPAVPALAAEASLDQGAQGASPSKETCAP